KATSLLIESGRVVDIRQLYFDLRKSLLHSLEEFEQKGFSVVLSRWHEYDVFLGRNMVWQRSDGTRLEGENLGPDEDGSLLVRDAQGTIHRVVSGEVSLIDICS
ncbi:MAG: biotin--[acetyl-CoA-carboxylase] ligase, partial [Desulfocapsaceae bacterium]